MHNIKVAKRYAKSLIDLANQKIGVIPGTSNERALAEALAQHTQASVVQVIGRVALLFRSRPVDPTIVLPRDAGAPPPPVHVCSAGYTI